MGSPTKKIGGGRIYRYDPVKATTLSAYSTFATGDVADLTTDPSVEGSGVRIQASTAYSIRVAVVGLALTGGLNFTAVSDAVSHTTAANATGIELTLDFPAKCFGIAVFVDGILNMIMPQAPLNRANGTACSGRKIPILFESASSALSSTSSLITGTVYGMTRYEFPDTTGATTVKYPSKTVDVTPAHSSDYKVITGRSCEITSKIYTESTDVTAMGVGGTVFDNDGKDITFVGLRGAASIKSRPYEVHIPGQEDTNDVILIFTGEMETGEATKEASKDSPGGIPIDIKSVPDTLTDDIWQFVTESF